MDKIFKALNDPVRRTLLDSLRKKDGQSLGELEAGLAMTRFGVMKHLKVLEDAGLVLSKKSGRFKYHYLNAQPLQEVIDRWIEPLLAAPMARAMTTLKTRLEGETDMAKPDFMMQTIIRTTQDALWDALTLPDQVAAYHFVCSDAAATETGGIVMYRPDGSTMLTQQLISSDPKTRLEYTFEPNWFEGVNEASRMVFLIEPEGPTCKLTCEHYAIPAGQEGVAEGWARHIASLKSWLETGQPIKLAA